MTAPNDSLRTLTELGQEQAEFTGRRLAEVLNVERLFPRRSAYSEIKFVQSPLRRAQETASIVMDCLNEALEKSRLKHKIDKPLQVLR